MVKIGDRVRPQIGGFLSSISTVFNSFEIGVRGSLMGCTGPGIRKRSYASRYARSGTLNAGVNFLYMLLLAKGDICSWF